MKILVTGAAGFIGCNLVRTLLARGQRVIGLDKLTYAGSLQSLAECQTDPGFAFVRADVADAEALAGVFAVHRPDAVIHLAAESHVDRSIRGPEVFVRSNIVGTFQLLQASLEHYRQLDPAGREQFRLLHVSTDEVYGSLDNEAPAFSETSPANPRSPYSASKAAADHLVHAWHHTYGLPVIVTRSSNNYGPWQHPEKLIPVVITRALQGEPIPVYGTGENIRDWLHVSDHVRALCLVLDRAAPGTVWNIGSGVELRNLELVQRVCGMLDQSGPLAGADRSSQGATPSCASQICFVADRAGHDWRYALETTRIRSELGWQPVVELEAGLRETVRWYLEHGEWWRHLLQREQASLPATGEPSARSGIDVPGAAAGARTPR